jgi:hypothetical protein
VDRGWRREYGAGTDEKRTGAGPPLRLGVDRGRVEAAHHRSDRRSGGGGDGGLGPA